MMARTHRLVSGSTALVVASAAGLPAYASLSAGGVAALSASWPDDVEKLLRLKHRRWSHRPIIQVAVFSIPVVVAAIWLPVIALGVGALAAAAWLGCFMHSIADGMTVHPSGIQYLWPLNRRGYHVLPRFMRVWVGSKSRSEWVFAACWCAFVLCYAYVRYRHSIPPLAKHA